MPKTYKFKLDIKKRWHWAEDKDVALLIAFLKTQINFHHVVKDNILYYNKTLTNNEQGQITGFMHGVLSFSYLIEDREAE